MKRIYTAYALTALVAIFFFGCKTATEPTSGGGNITVVHPAVGSSYTYHSTTKDSTGATKDQSDYTQTVSAVNVAIGGRTDAIQLDATNSTDPEYYAIAANGDILVYMGDPSGMSDAPHTWVKMPFSGGAGTSITLIDTTGDMLGIGVPVHMVLSLTTSADGAESVTAAGKTFNALKANMSVKLQMTVATQTFTTTMDQYAWLAPEIGNIVKTDQPSYRDASTGQTSDSQTDILTSYTLK
jgi:hypothetical protein